MIYINEDLLIYKKYENLVYYVNNLLKKFPKSERMFLTKEIYDNMHISRETILFAEKEFNKGMKVKYLNNLDVYFKLLKSYVRMAYKYKYISMQNYSTFSEYITEISNMLGGWIKSCLKV